MTLPSLKTLLLGAALLLSGCASTTVTLRPEPQLPVCAPQSTALLLWMPQWRPDQKDVAQREQAAAAGLERFLSNSICFAQWQLHRVESLAPSQWQALLREAATALTPAPTRVVTLRLRELGPVVKLLASAALIEGGTEVVLEVAEYDTASVTPLREFSLHWRHGGPGVIKGVASLPEDMAAALTEALQPPLSISISPCSS
ncbi:MAG: hypothetical protein RJA44_1057 [Pseudomonadota bacterium]